MGAAKGDGENRPSTAEVREHLARVLASAAFRGSKRCHDFLEFVVEHALAGHLEMLKERTIGVELFARDPSYDSAADSIVRVKANEVRKRLAQYYQESRAREGVRIELPSGSYVPEFHRAEPERAASTARRPQLLTALPWGIAVLATLLAIIPPLARWNPFPSDLTRFWAPILSSPEKVIVCGGTSRMVHVSRPLRRTLERMAGGESGLASGLKVGPDDIADLAGDWVARGNFYALLDLTSFLQKAGKPVTIRLSSDLAFQELRDQPIILIGAFNNTWTTELSKDHRFYFERPASGGDPVWMIRDRLDPRKNWAVRGPHPWDTDVDYAIVSRFAEPGKQRTVVSAAGISWYGTQVAGDFLTSAERWREVAWKAPPDWHRKNLQLVLETRVVAKTPTPAKVVATHFW